MKISAGDSVSRRARIEIIPLIDIVFFLLATFVMVSLSMVRNQGISVKLPIAASSQPESRENTVTISINKDGAIYLNKDELSLERLSSELRRQKEVAPDLKIFLNADADTRFQPIVTVLDETRKLGITRVAIETGGK